MKYQCSVCKHEGLKLWRPWNNGDVVLKCASCLNSRIFADEFGRVWDNYGWNDQITSELGVSWGPACPCDEPELGGGFWGYTSVPESAVKRWKALPTYLTKIGLEEYKEMRANSYDRLAMRHRLTDEAAIYAARICLANTPRPASPPAHTVEGCVAWAEELANRLEAGHGDGPEELGYFKDLSSNLLKENARLLGSWGGSNKEIERQKSIIRSQKDRIDELHVETVSAAKHVRDFAALLDEKDAKAKQWGEPLDMTASRVTKAIQALQNEVANSRETAKEWYNQYNRLIDVINYEWKPQLGNALTDIAAWKSSYKTMTVDCDTWKRNHEDLSRVLQAQVSDNGLKYRQEIELLNQMIKSKDNTIKSLMVSGAALIQYLRNFVAILDGDGGHTQTGEDPGETAKRAEKALYALLASRDKAENEKQIAVDAYYVADQKRKEAENRLKSVCDGRDSLSNQLDKVVRGLSAARDLIASGGVQKCACRWNYISGSIGQAVPSLKPCAGHGVYGDWRASEARKEVFTKIRSAFGYDFPKHVSYEAGNFVNNLIKRIESEYK